MREIDIQRRLSHPNVVKLYEYIDDPNEDRLFLSTSLPYCVMCDLGVNV
jgi:serine/threonine protein kinase